MPAEEREGREPVKDVPEPSRRSPGLLDQADRLEEERARRREEKKREKDGGLDLGRIR